MSNLDYRPLFTAIGVLLAALGAAMSVPALTDIAFGHPDWSVFAISGGLTVTTGIALWLSSRGRVTGMTVRQAFLMTTGAWLALTAFGAIPLYWSGIVPTYTDAFFEAMSGITTTGATVITGLDTAPPGILMWRAMLQWLGGLGIIVMAVAVLPLLQIGGMQMFKAEAFDTAENIVPRARQLAGSLALVYMVISALCMMLYAFAGMELMDAVMHAMTTVATGGFSSHDESFAYFENARIDVVAVLFMGIGSLPFALYLRALQGSATALLRDSQVRAFVGLVAGFTALAWVYEQNRGVNEGLEALRYAAFNVMSIMTGTGYANHDYNAWGPFAAGLFFVLMFIGGCAGSTSCGLKVFRVQVLVLNLAQHVRRSIFPHGVFNLRYNGLPLADTVSSAVLSFFFLYLVTFATLAMLLSVVGLDPMTAISGAASAISNVGPGLGDIIGPTGTYKPLNDVAKWLLSAGMLLGRLELLTVLVLFLPRFWRG